MKLASYSRNGHKAFGLVTGRGIVDLHRLYSGRYPDLRAFLSSPEFPKAGCFASAPVDAAFDDIEFLPVIENPDKIIGIGANYPDEAGRVAADAPAALFVRFPYTQVGHLAPLCKPARSDAFDYEGELAVVIGRAGHRIDVGDAYAHVAGYSCYMDGSVRDWQGTSFTAGKNWPRTAAFGPWLVTPDEIPDPHVLGIRTRVDGREMQNDNTGRMLRRIPELIARISAFAPLEAGDVIVTGTPAGTGKSHNPQLFLREGSTVEVEIDHIGCLTNAVAGENESHSVPRRREPGRPALP